MIKKREINYDVENPEDAFGENGSRLLEIYAELSKEDIDEDDEDEEYDYYFDEDDREVDYGYLDDEDFDEEELYENYFDSNYNGND